jgi:hypothetical protein
VLEPAELDARAATRISGPPLQFLDGETLQGLLLLNKMVRKKGMMAHDSCSMRLRISLCAVL